MSDEKLILREALYVPAHLVTRDMRDAFTYTWKEKIVEKRTVIERCCGECKNWQNKKCIEAGYVRYSQVCKNFEAPSEIHYETKVLTTHKQLDANTYVFGRGDLGKITKYFGNLPIEDQRSAPPLGFDLECRTNLYAEQQQVVAEWLKHGYGIIKAPTAFGKSLLFVYLICKLKMRTLLLAQEVRHLRVGLDALYEHTNIRELEESLGTPIAGQLNYINNGTPENPKLKKQYGVTYPITFSTYQSLNAEKGKELLPSLRDSFGLVFCEEAHHSSAMTFHHVIKSFNPWYRGGLTATPTRKDQTHVAIYDTIGPVTARGITEQMLPRVTFIHTGVKVPDWLFRRQYPIVKLHSWLAQSQDYQSVLFDWLMQDIRDGRKPFVFTERRAHATWLARQVELAGYRPQVVMSGIKDADQAKITKLLMDGRVHCVIGTKVLRENVNIPPLDVVHLSFPCFGKEMEEQVIGRIRRYLRDPDTKEVMPDAKPQPLVRVYTYESNHNIPQAAVRFRRGLYKEWGFEFDDDVNVIEEKKELMSSSIGKGKSMKDWMNSFKVCK